jgi:1-acyl-sn-glycerol-3-phosphate acyltransferase
LANGFCGPLALIGIDFTGMFRYKYGNFRAYYLRWSLDGFMLRSAVLVLLAGLWTGLVSSFIILGYSFFPRGEYSVHVIAQRWAKGVLWLSGVKVEVTGTENIILDGPQIFMANHQSFFDIFIVLAFIPAQFRFIAKKELFRVPIFGGALRKYGTIEINRQHHVSAVASIDEAARKIREGKSVVTFPEGTRSIDGEIKAFKKGVFHLALKAGVPIVPISIIGSREILPKHSLKVNPGRIRMIFDGPIEIDGYSDESRDDLIARVRDVIVRNFHEARQDKAA